MRTLSIGKDGSVTEIVYDKTTQTYYYGDGTPIPQSELDKFPTTVFKRPNPRPDLSNFDPEEWTRKFQEGMKKRIAQENNK
jgi:hypothetical protein